MNFDASLFKDFQPVERLTAQFRFDSFNIFNHLQFGQPNANIGNAAVGTITSTVGNPRQMQVASRLVF